MKKLVGVVVGSIIVFVLSAGVSFAEPEWMICTPVQVGVRADWNQVQVKVRDCNVEDRNGTFLRLDKTRENQMMATILTAISLQSKVSIGATPIPSQGYSTVQAVFVRNN